MKLPRVHCGKCDRPIAAGPVAGRLGKGRIWRHDPPVERRLPDERLVSCGGSLEVVDLPYGQTEIHIDEPDSTAEAEPDEAMALF